MAAEEADKFLEELFGPGEGAEPETPPSPASSSKEVEAVDPSLVPEPLRTEEVMQKPKHYDYVGYHMEKEAAKKQAVLATLARLEAPSSSTAPVRTLASEMRKRPSERTLVPPTVEETADPTLLGLLLKKLGQDGYHVSGPYATKLLLKNDCKLLPAIKNIKYDIQFREATLHATGRVSIPQEEARHFGQPHLKTRDQLIAFLETEDKQYREIGEKGWGSTIGVNLKVNSMYKTQAEREAAFKYYVQENQFRNLRAEYYESCKSQGISEDEKDACMDEWDRQHRIPQNSESRAEQAAEPSTAVSQQISPSNSSASNPLASNPTQPNSLASNLPASNPSTPDQSQSNPSQSNSTASNPMAPNPTQSNSSASNPSPSHQLPSNPSPSYQATVEDDEEEITETTPIFNEESKASIDEDSKIIDGDILEKVESITKKVREMRRQTSQAENIAEKPQDTRVPTHPAPPTHLPTPIYDLYNSEREYNPYEKLLSAAETFQINAQIAEYEAAKSSPPKAKEYEPDHMNQWNFPKTLANVLEGDEFYSEDPLLDCLKNLAENISSENAALREANTQIRHEKVDRKAQREEQRMKQMANDMLNNPQAHAGEKLEILLTEIPKVVAGRKPVNRVQIMAIKRDVIKNMRHLYEFLNEAQYEESQINQLAEHMKGKTVFNALSESYSEDNIKRLEPVLTDGLRKEMNALFEVAKKVDAQIQRSTREVTCRDKSRANVDVSIQEVQDQVVEIYSAVHDELMEIPYNRTKLESMRRDLEIEHSTLSDILEEVWKKAIRSTIYFKIETDSLEAAWDLVVQAAKDVDNSLKEKPKKKPAKYEPLGSFLDTVLDKLRVPLWELLPRWADVIEFQKMQKEANEPEPENEKAPYKSAVLRLFQEFENLSEELQAEISETTDRDAVVEELWNQPEVIQSLEEAALPNKGKGKLVDESLVHVMGMHSYASRLLEAPLIQQLVAEELQEEVRREVGHPLPQGHFSERVMEQVENDIQQLMQEAKEEHNIEIQEAIQSSLETEKTRMLKKQVSVSDGLRKKMAKAKIEKRLSEFVGGGAASSEIDLKEGVEAWNEEHALDNVNPSEKSPATVEHVTIPPVTGDNDMIKFAVEWYNNKEKNEGKLPGHEDCKCSAEDHAYLEQILTDTAETAQKLRAIGLAKAAAQMSLARLDGEEVAESSPKLVSTGGQKFKGKAQKKTVSSQTKSTGQPSSSASQSTGNISDSQYPAGYDATPSGFKDAISEATGEPLDMETLRLHDRLLQLNHDIAAGTWDIRKHDKGSERHVVRMTGMELDWAPTALNICGNSAALAVAFVLAANEEIKKYLVKKGLPTTQSKIDYEGFRFGLRCQDHHINQLDISLGKKPRYPFGYGFNTVENYNSVMVPAPCAPPDSLTDVAPGAPSSSKPVVASGSSSNAPSASASTPSAASGPSKKFGASSSTTAAGPSGNKSSASSSSLGHAASSNIAHLATIIQTAATPSIDRSLAIQIATMIETSVSSAVLEAANIPGLTAEMVSALAANAQIPLPPNFNASMGASSGQATQSDITGASSSASLETGSDTTPSGSSGGNKKKKRQAVKKGGRRR